ncbi:MAG: VCBS repeat-containing protein, partial [Candidatus Saccharibacteria bacterium]|nr:VCBS repeat-containing protein [Candidatus Saccharibacteria bacterium]
MFANLYYSIRPSSISWFVLCLSVVALSTQAQVSQTPGSLIVDRLGAAVYTLPIAAPNGIGGVKPNITALYNSQAANGLLGKGGSVGGLSSIKRCNQTLVRDGVNKVISWSAEDRFCIDAQRLMLVAGAQGDAESQYKTEIDNGVVYTAKGGTAGNPDYFEARAEDGATLVFGGMETAKEQGAATMTWALSQYKDAANNAIEYVHEGTSADGLRIKRINYAFPIPNTTSNPGAYIDFIYKDRDDPISRYVAGYEFRTNKLLTQINSYSLLGLLHRSYQFDLATSSGLAGYVTRWQGVDECKSFSTCFAITQFTWGTTKKSSAGTVELKDIGVEWLHAVSKKTQYGYSPTNAKLSDLTGDGIAELVWNEKDSDNYTHTYAAFNVGTLAFDAYSLSSAKYATLSETSTPLVGHFQFADINNDGRSDLIIPGYFDSSSNMTRPKGLLVERNNRYWAFSESSLSVGNGDRFTIFADLHGDGLVSQINMSRDLSSISITKTKKGLNKTADQRDYYGFHESLHNRQNVLSDIRLKGPSDIIQTTLPWEKSFVVGDFDGDLKQDLLGYFAWYSQAENATAFKLNWYSYSANQLQLKKNLFLDKRTGYSANSQGQLNDQVGLAGLNVPDINGDGLSDIAFRIGANWRYALSKGEGFTEYVSWPSTPGSANWDPVWFFDVNRDGSEDVIRYSYDSVSKTYIYYVNYWIAKENKFSEANAIRSTPYHPLTVGDANGDSWLDFVELDGAAKSNNQDYIRVYGYANTSGGFLNGHPGVLAADAITQIKSGIVADATIAYQPMSRSSPMKEELCSSAHSSQKIPCQNFHDNSNYKILKESVVLPPLSFDATSVDYKPYYKATNEPFALFENPYINQARVNNWLKPVPIVTEIKKSARTGLVSKTTLVNKQFTYWHMRSQAGGRGLLGYEKTIVKDLLTGNSLETNLRQDWPFTGMPNATTIYTSYGKILSESVNALSTSAVGSQIEKVYKPKIDSIT